MIEGAIVASQIDREAAAEIGRRFAHWTPQQIKLTLDGKGDEYPIVQAFARHRIAVLNAMETIARTNPDFKTDFKTAQAGSEEIQ